MSRKKKEPVPNHDVAEKIAVSLICSYGSKVARLTAQLINEKVIAKTKKVIEGN